MSHLLGEFSEADLLVLARDQNEAAFNELIGRARHRCLTIARSILGDEAETEDRMQDAFFKAWLNLSGFREDASFTTWICRIVANECLMLTRRRRRYNEFSIDEFSTPEVNRGNWLRDTRANPEEILAKEEIGVVVARELGRLPKMFRTVLVLAELDGLTTNEVAAHLHISVPAVKSRLIRARRELRTRVEAHAGRMGPATLLSQRA
jgi:RNA polymerase sigma-70 factor (ECF subfamily)